jgi:glyceraldehyde 3-phosphate dehydrogenase
MSRVPRIAVNGFGRIGRLVTRALLNNRDKVDFVGINDLSDPEMMAHLFEYDSVHGHYKGTVEIDGADLVFDGDRLRTLTEKDPAKLPWNELEVDYVFECTGRFRGRADLQKHVEAGAKRVILSAPGKDVDATFVRGVNFDTYDPEKHRIVSNASCTTNCLAPVLKVLHESFGLEHAVMTTVHAYTNDQRLLDSQHKDLRRARAAALSMIPTSTGAAKAIGLVMPELDGKVDGLAIRVPTPNVSLVDLTARMKEAVTKEAIVDAFAKAATGPLDGILRCEERPLVSSDFNHDPSSAVIDVPSVTVVDRSLVKVLAWYDNEWGYANRTAELAMDMWRREPGVDKKEAATTPN